MSDLLKEWLVVMQELGSATKATIFPAQSALWRIFFLKIIGFVLSLPKEQQQKVVFIWGGKQP